MKRIISLILTVVMLFGAITVLSACGAPDNAGAKIAVYLGDEVYDFDPTAYYTDSNAEQLMTLLFEPLFSISKRGKLKCAAAEDYEVDEEKRTIVIKLRESYWSDDTLVLATHFTKAWERLLSPTSANPAAALFYDIEGAYETKNGTAKALGIELGIARTESDEITIKYREGADYEQILRNLASVATAPIHYDYYNQAPNYWATATSLNTFVTNGPFKVSRIAEGALTVERNVGYHQSPEEKDYDDIVRPHMLNSVFGVDGESVQMLVNGEMVDITYDQLVNNTVFYMGNASLADRQEYKKKADVIDSLSTYTYVFNTTKPIFAIKEVRQALSLAIDRDAIIDAITFGKAATGFIPEASVDANGKSFRKNNAILATSENIIRANELLDSVSAQISAAGGLNITLTVNKDEESLKIAELVKAQWEQLNNVSVTIDARHARTLTIGSGENETEIEDSWIQLLANNAVISGERDFDVLALDWQMYSDDAFVALAGLSSGMGIYGFNFVEGTNAIGDSKLNVSGWKNDAYDALVAAAYSATDAKERSEKLHDAEKLLLDEMPIIPIVFNQNFAFTSKEISKLTYDGYGHFVLTDLKLRKYEQYFEKK